jgi:hypothetical protein
MTCPEESNTFYNVLTLLTADGYLSCNSRKNGDLNISENHRISGRVYLQDAIHTFYQKRSFLRSYV